MPLSEQRRRQFDAILQSQGMGSPSAGVQTTLSPDRRSQFDSALGVQTPIQQTPVETQGKNNFLSQVFKPIGRTIATAGSAIDQAANIARGDIEGAKEAATRERKTGFGVWRPVGIDEQGQEKSLGGQVKDILGTGAGVASFAAPASLGATGARGLAAGGALAGALGSGGEALQEDKGIGKVLSSSIGGALGGAALGAAIPGAGKLLGAGTRKASRGLGEVASGILGSSTGAGSSAIKEAFTNPNVIKFARSAGKEGPESLMKKALTEAKRSLDSIFTGNSKAYNEALTRIKASPAQFDEAFTVLRKDILQDATEGYGIRFTDGKKLNNLDFNKSDIVEGSPSVQRAFDRMFGEKVSTVKDLDRLKRSLGRIANGAPNGSPAQALIYQMKGNVSRILKDEVPGYAQEMSRFSQVQDLAEEIEKVLSLGDNRSVDTAVRKLMSTMRQNNELRKEMLDLLGQKSGKDIIGKIAGATLAPSTPRGLAGVLQPTATTVGGASAIINPSTIPALLIYLASSSPRLVAEAVNILGKVKGRAVPPAVQRQLRNLLIQASQEVSNGATQGGDQETLGIQ